MKCYPSKVVCTSLALYCILNEIINESTINDNDTVKKKKLIELSDAEMKTLFERVALKILENLTENALSSILSDLSLKILNLISSISNNLNHKKIPDDLPPLYFYINFWLRGHNPPPRCQAFINEVLCEEEASKYSQYCDLLHCCRSNCCKNQRISYDLNFCLEHICQFHECKSETFENTKFCSKHVCPACILANSREVKFRDPYACEEHTCRVDKCNKIQIYPYFGFCIDHVCIECASLKEAKEHFSCLVNSRFCQTHNCSVPNCKNNRLNEEIEYCNFHVCRLCYEKNIFSGADTNYPQSQLCQVHRCSHPDICFEAKVESSMNCVDHSCKECISLKCSTINPAVDQKPRNSCTIHSLCTFVNNEGNYNFLN
jgi:hypothetical protein